MNLKWQAVVVSVVVGLASVVGAGVPAQPEIKQTKVVDVSKLGNEIRGYQIPGSATVLLIFYNKDHGDGPSTTIFAGSEKILFQQESLDSVSESIPDDWILRTTAPRSTWHLGRGLAGLEYSKGSMTLGCGKDPKTESEMSLLLTPLTEKAVHAVVAKATFRTSALIRRPVSLSRDDTGIYYFVDRLRDDLGGEGYRVFVGKRGAMKQLPLVDVANDSAGMVFATAKGDLRLTINAEKPNEPATTVWAKKKSIVTLHNVGIGPASSYLIHRDLGIYGAMGTLCEDR